MNPTEVPHPGVRIKSEVIPVKMSVAKAAALLGVGRPALSNLLNGKAALSADMAARLEKTFNKFSRKELLNMQAEYDAVQARKKAPVDMKAYVPPFLGIRANQIEEWIEHNTPARTRLSVFLRTLVHSTGRGLTKVDFPGNDDAERPGWDGFVEAGEGTPWVPAGASGWEFGTNKDIKKKANGDFEKSVKAHDKKVRDETTFVFVTPRNWPGKGAWIEEAKAKFSWKDVRAYDSSDLEQWLEQSIPGQAWFANETGIPAQEVRSLDRCWAKWANVAIPPLTGALFSSAINAGKRVLMDRLKNPPTAPIVIAADSTEEALAFLAQAFSLSGGEELANFRDRVLVFNQPGVLPRLAEGTQSFIPVAFTREVEREFSSIVKSMHTIVVYPRNAVSSGSDVVLEPVPYQAFNAALCEMGKSRDEVNRLGNESGCSLTVLRRRLATGALRTPEWADNADTAKKLVPFLFVGAWHSENDEDRSFLSLLAANRPYHELEKEIQALSLLNDAPVWSIGTYRGVISKIDLLYAIANTITAEDLKRYFQVAEIVLGEDDPSLDLDEDKRWAAAIYGKTRKFSKAFREGISETLVLLSLYGNHLFEKRTWVNAEDESAQLVRRLLNSPLTTRVLEANDSDLPTYAEAAPDEFLSILERDLKLDNPATLGLLRPASIDVFSSPSRIGLLHALEGLAWNPDTIGRAVLILARLAQVEIDDNWVNKPIKSMEAIFSAWMPQTAADHDVRVGLMKRLVKLFPDVAWRICVAQFGGKFRGGHYNHKPRWRTDGYGFGEPLSTSKSILEFTREMIEMALNWKTHSLLTLSDLVARLQNLSPEYQTRVWSLVENWAKDSADDSSKAAMCDKIRISILSRRAEIQSKKDERTSALVAKAKVVYASLDSSDALNKNIWLFLDRRVDEFADEIKDCRKVDFQKYEERIQNQRAEAMREIVAQHGVAGLIKLAMRGKESWAIGAVAVTKDVLVESKLIELVQMAFQLLLKGTEKSFTLKNIIAGVLQSTIDNDVRGRIIKAASRGASEEDLAGLLTLGPYSSSIWKLVDTLGEAAQSKYWSEVVPDGPPHLAEESNEGVERLLKAGRPHAAFSYICSKPDQIDAQVLYRLLSDMARGCDNRQEEYMLEHFNLEQAFKYLDNSPILTLDQKARLEFSFIEVLAHPWVPHAEEYGIPNLEKYIEVHPEMFLKAIVWTYKRKDGGRDPESITTFPEHAKVMADRGYRRLLDSIRRLPGHNEMGELTDKDLSEWITTVRTSAAELSRIDVADTCIGKLLSHAPIGEDGIWPCNVVRDVLEDFQSEFLMEGMRIGVYNSRGVYSPSEGGDQDRELAMKYRRWAKEIQSSHPYVASVLLMKMASKYEADANQEEIEFDARRRLR